MTKRWTCALLSTLSAAACGGNSIDSGVDDDKKASELTPEEYERVCQAFSDGIADATSPERQHELGCRVRGFVQGAIANAVLSSTSAIREACQEKYEECLDEGPGGGVMASMVQCSAARNCDVTVGEVERCGNDIIAWVDGIRALYPTCSELNANSFGEGSDEAETPAFPTSCNVFQEC